MTGPRRPLIPLILVWQLAGPAGAAPSAGEAREELKDLRARIEALQKRLAETEETRGEAVDALKSSERAISEANRRLHELADQSRAAKSERARLEAEARRVGATLGAQQARLERLLYQHYVNGRDEPLKLILNRQDPNEIARQLHYFGYVSRARAELIATLREGLERVASLSREAKERETRIDAIARDEDAQRRRLEQERQARAQVLARVARDLRDQQREIGTLKRNETRLARLVDELARAVARARPRGGLRNERVPDGSTAGVPFEALKGRLALPVRGELGNRFGSPRSDGGLTWKGIFIAAKAGEAVKAVAAGRVVFADWLRGFGNLLIIDHGGAYMSLYANNDTLLKQVGQEIRGGDTIAAVGNSGGNDDSGLYFELRHQGKPFDPLTWVNVR